MNTKESLELVYLRLVALLVEETDPEHQTVSGTRSVVNMERVMQIVKTIDSIKYLIDTEELDDDLPHLMSEMPTSSDFPA